MDANAQVSVVSQQHLVMAAHALRSGARILPPHAQMMDSSSASMHHLPCPRFNGAR